MSLLADNPTGSKAKLIEATIGLLSTKGFQSTGIHDILDAADVTKSNFYYHFKSKEELCLAALDEIILYIQENIVKPTFKNTDLSPKQRIQAYFNCMAAMMDDRCCQGGCPMVNLAIETSDYFPSFQDKIKRFYENSQQTIETCYQEGVQKGEFRSDIDPTMISSLILSLMQGNMVLSKTLKQTDIIRHTATTFFKLTTP